MTTINRATWTDDDGSGTTGTIINNARLQGDIYDKIDGALASLDGKNTSQDTAITNNANAIAALQTGVGVKAFNNAGQAIGASAYTVLTFTGTDFIYGSMWIAGAPTRLTVPAGQGGTYAVYATALEVAGNGNLRLRFKKNGAVVATEARLTASSVQVGCNIVSMLQLAAGDYLEVEAFAGAAVTIGGSTRDQSSEFGMWKI